MPRVYPPKLRGTLLLRAVAWLIELWILLFMLSLSLSAFTPVVLMTSSGGGSGGIMGLLFPLLLIGLVFYFFIYKPQKDREQEHEDMVANLEQGDKIVTIGGIHGTIQRIDDDSVLAQVDSKGTKLRIDKQAIASSGEDDDE